MKGIPKFHDIPYNTNYNSWGSLKTLSVNKSIISNVTFNSDINFIEIESLDPVTKLITVSNKDESVFKFNDIDLRDEANNYKRVFLFTNENIEVYFKDNIAFFYMNRDFYKPKYKKDKNGNLTNERIDIIKPLKKESKIKDKFITFDLETYFSDTNSIELLSASFYDGESAFSVFRGNFKTDKAMLDHILRKYLLKNIILDIYLFIMVLNLT